jgi:hypothetical protein
MEQKRIMSTKRGWEQKRSMEGEKRNRRGAVQDKWDRDEMKRRPVHYEHTSRSKLPTPYGQDINLLSLI